MPKPEEIEDADNLDEEDNSDDTDDEEDEDEEESDDSDDSSDDDDEDDDSDGDDEDEEEDDDSDDEDDSDDDSKKPLTKKERKQLASLLRRKGAKGEKNRSAAARRKSEKGAFSKTRKVDDSRIANLEKTTKQLALEAKKRSFGHKTGLAPDEVDTLHRITGRLKSKDLKDPVVKGALDGLRGAKRVKGNVPSTHSRPFRPNSKEVKNMTPTERRSAFADRRRGILAEKQGR